ncbi:Chloride channel protein B, partial [Varanus komodoensis]
IDTGCLAAGQSAKEDADCGICCSSVSPLRLSRPEHKGSTAEGEEQLLLAEDQPDLIESLNPQCNDYRSCSQRRTFLQEKEKEQLSMHESLDYLPSHSSVYKKWLQGQTYRMDWDRWLMMGIIGIAVGTLGFLIHQIIDYLIKLKWELVENYIQFFCPTGAPSGLPEVIGFLNGTSIQQIFNFRTFVGTFGSCILAVASGLFCGPEGPMIHLGAIIGYGLSQFKVTVLGSHLPSFTRFWNTADKRNFVTAGAGAGIASVFHAPVGGLLFTLEEVASFWDIQLAWQTFFCCLTAAFTTDLLSSSLCGFVYRGQFGFFKAEKRILFWVKNLLDMSVLAFVPAIFLGILGGLLGAFFVFLNIKINKLRMWFFSTIPKTSIRKIGKLLESVLVLVSVEVHTYRSPIHVVLPGQFPCLFSYQTELILSTVGLALFSIPYLSSTLPSFQLLQKAEIITLPFSWLLVGELTSTVTFLTITATVYLPYFFHCTPVKKLATFDPASKSQNLSHASWQISEYNCAPAISHTGSNEVKYSNQTFNEVGMVFNKLFEIRLLIIWETCRGLIILRNVEITNDVQSLLLIMLAVMVAKMVGDWFNMSLYSSLLKLKCIPYLDAEPVVCHRKKWDIARHDTDLGSFIHGW